MKVAVFGCKSTTIYFYNELRRFLSDEFEITVITIDSETADKNVVADYTSIANIVDIIYIASSYSLNTEADFEYFSDKQFDIGFVIGWQRLVPNMILETIRAGCYGMHGSALDLPRGRGRSPMNWALIEGRTHFYTNLFKYDAGVDSGDIVDRFVFSINSSDTAETLHYKNLLSMVALVKRNFVSLLSQTKALKAQPHIGATYYPKRNPADSQIDWYQDINRLDKFIRAVAPPFGGAFSYLSGERVRIFRACIFETDLVDFNILDVFSPGTILSVFPSGKFLVRCINGLLIVHEYDLMTHEKLTVGSRLTVEGDIKYFPRNVFGDFDLSE